MPFSIWPYLLKYFLISIQTSLENIWVYITTSRNHYLFGKVCDECGEAYKPNTGLCRKWRRSPFPVFFFRWTLSKWCDLYWRYMWHFTFDRFLFTRIRNLVLHISNKRPITIIKDFVVHSLCSSISGLGLMRDS